jgi:hypothetical protein
MALLTYFKATLPCAHGGHVGTAWIPSHLGSRGATYQAGDCPGDDIPDANFASTSFSVRPVVGREPVRVLHSWTCETCRLESFVEVVFADGCVIAIEPTDLTPATLGRVHYIGEELDEMLQAIAGVSPYESAEWLPTLRSALEAGRRWGA